MNHQKQKLNRTRACCHYESQQEATASIDQHNQPKLGLDIKMGSEDACFEKESEVIVFQEIDYVIVTK
eukprot:1487868-Amphidinium_carterae.1